MNRSQLLSWIFVGVGACGGVASAQTLPPSLRACMSESDAGRRLACFDRESAQLTSESAPAKAAPAAAATAAAAAEKTPAEKFGYRGNIARAEIDKKDEEERSAAEQLTATVTELATLAHGELVLTLDNGQVWQQKAGDRAMRIKVGDAVTIKRGSMNSFLLTSEAKGSMRVARVK